MDFDVDFRETFFFRLQIIVFFLNSRGLKRILSFEMYAFLCPPLCPKTQVVRRRVMLFVSRPSFLVPVPVLLLPPHYRSPDNPAAQAQRRGPCRTS